ncbi:MAG: 4-hydroxythreonine-4-phosphate dehydrogenase PdxA [Acidisphaera sp.]|nr:4-hydroxythreonine-4-phosphate dehydrogenase PdxA [Acidisphaera sp.]MBV9813563.1 4-hydroxythreonine-4-phosphate dehydrogenase PdxA [Acetobacteraceae bacterium]
MGHTIPPIALTMGDPAGITAEITAKAWRARRGAACAFAALDDPARYDCPTETIATLAQAHAVFPRALPVLPVPLATAPTLGSPDPANAPAVIASIEAAARLALAGEACAVVTNPISKATLYGAGFPYPGHTEFLAALTGTALPVMMLLNRALRVVPVTIHVSLRRALALLDAEAIVRTALVTASALRRDFGLRAPRLAVAGLNPHAGEAGALGDEESTIVQPAIERLRADGIDVSGPWPPDTMFTPAARARYDVAICMYHDQALIPLKTLDMTTGVNVTLGLPIVRTSPDHGTAFDIAGRGVADPSSLLAALDLAADLAARREAVAA